LVVAEAAAKGVPAIVSDISAAAERVVDGKTGWHMRSGDAEDLKRCLLLTHNDEIISKAGQAAYDDFWESPPVRSRHIEGLLHIYNIVSKGA
jgi:glycosyltransferase involved in cell wall biosynthesis